MNLLEIGLAFVEGRALIVSLCILPVLPLVLSASVEEGRGRPYGIITTTIAKYGIQYPVAVDNNLSTWVAFHNRYWPAHYLIDKNGQTVYTHFGEGTYNRTEKNIHYLLGLNKKAEGTPEAAVVSVGQTPETYLGYARADRCGAGLFCEVGSPCRIRPRSQYP